MGDVIAIFKFKSVFSEHMLWFKFMDKSWELTLTNCNTFGD